MPGVKGKSGGARSGAGRKAKPPMPPVPSNDADPLNFLRRVWKGELDASPTQVRAASAALPFVHQKLGEGGKKEQRDDAAKKIAGRFGAAAPPRLAAAGGKKV